MVSGVGHARNRATTDGDRVFVLQARPLSSRSGVDAIEWPIDGPGSLQGEQTT